MTVLVDQIDPAFLATARRLIDEVGVAGFIDLVLLDHSPVSPSQAASSSPPAPAGAPDPADYPDGIPDGIKMAWAARTPEDQWWWDNMPLELQIGILGHVIMTEFPGEPSRSEGAIECAVRLLRDLQAKVGNRYGRVLSTHEQATDAVIETARLHANAKQARLE